MKASRAQKPYDYELLKKNDEFLKGMFESKRFHEARIDRPYSKRYEVAANRHQHAFWKYIQYCIDSAPKKGLWMEFGVSKGNSARYISSKIKKTYYGFDSLNGLPCDWIRFSGDTEALKGAFSVNGVRPTVPYSNFKLIEGWFEDTLERFLKENSEPCAFVHIDSDVYSSAKTVLECLHKNQRLVSGTVILFDEFFGYEKYADHEYKAFKEFVYEYNISFDWLAYTTGASPWNGQQASIILR
jgi:hypothetical protein